MTMEVTKIQDDGTRFILHGSEDLEQELSEALDRIGMGVSVSSSDRGAAEVLYTDNNRDIVLSILHDTVDSTGT